MNRFLRYPMIALFWALLITVSGAAFAGWPAGSSFLPGTSPTITSVAFVDTAGGATVVQGLGFVGVPNVVATVNGTDYKLINVANSSGSVLTATLDPSHGPYTVGGWKLTVTNPDGESAVLTGSGVNNCTSGFVVFSPECLSNLVFDFDPTQSITCSSVTCTNGASVDNWPDISGNSVTATASGSNRPTFHTNVQNGYPSVDGDGSAAWMTTGNISWSAKTALVCGVFKTPSSTNNAVIWEQTNNSRTGSVNGFGLEYQTNGPQYDVYSGSSGLATLNEVVTITGADTNNFYRVACFSYDRTTTYPVTTVAAQAVQEESFYAGAKAGQGYLTAQTSSSNWDSAPFSFYARNNGSGAAAAPSNVSFLRLFAYKSIPSVSTIHNIITAMQSRYATVVVPYTGQFLSIGDSISSVFDTFGDLSYTTYMYVNRFFENRQFDVFSVSGWTAGDANLNRTTWAASRRSDVPVDVGVALGTNDLAANDTLSPSSLWTTNLQPLISYLHGLSSPAIRNIYVATILPRGVSTLGSSTAISFEARREGLKEDGTSLNDWVAGHSYSTNDWIYHSCSGTLTLFRAQANFTSASPTAPTFTCSDGSLTNDNGTTGAWKSYGIPINVLLRDSGNQSTYGYTDVDVGNPSTALGTCANVRSLTYYLSDNIHPQPTYQTGQTVPTSPNGPPFSGSILKYWYDLLKETGPSGIPYPAPIISSVAVQATGGTTAALGAPVTLSGHSFGEVNITHPLVLVDSSNVSWDFTSLSRTSDQIISAVVPTGIATGGPYTIIYKRADGQTATLLNALTIATPAVTDVQVAAAVGGTAASIPSGTMPATLLNTFLIKIPVSLGGGYGASAASFNGVSLTSVTYASDGSAVYGTLGTGTRSATSGTATVTSPSSPTSSVTAAFGTVDPSTIFAAGVVRGWWAPSSLNCSGTTFSSWTGLDSIGPQSLTTLISTPACITTSTNFFQNGTGIQTASFDVSTGAEKTSFSLNSSTGLPIFYYFAAHYGTSANGTQRFNLLNASGCSPSMFTDTANKPKMSADNTGNPFTTWGSTENGASVMMYGTALGVITNDVSTLNVGTQGVWGTELSTTAAEAESHLQNTSGTYGIGAIGANTGVASLEVCAHVVGNIVPSTAQHTQMGIYLRNQCGMSVACEPMNENGRELPLAASGAALAAVVVMRRRRRSADEEARRAA